MANVADSQVVLELLSAKTPTGVIGPYVPNQGIHALAVASGDCHVLPHFQAESSVAGVKLQNLLLLGKVVS